jgi:hypothetical protein
MSKLSHSTSSRVAFSQPSPSIAPAPNIGLDAMTPTVQPSMRARPVVRLRPMVGRSSKKLPGSHSRPRTRRMS